MKQSKLFTKTRKEAPADEISKNAELLIRAGFIHKEMAGAYMYLPLGLRVLKKIENIIREEMNSIEGQEISMTALQNPEIFKKTDRWDIPEIWFKTDLNNGTKLGLGFSHEEPLVNMLTNYISSYKDLPVSIYQFQTKFRNELRAKSGILRGREFIMKDMYSFHTSKEDFESYYERAKTAYTNIFRRVGIGHLTYITFASGGIFSKYSHEFQTITSAGEDKIYIDENRAIAVNEEVYTDEVLENLGLDKATLVEQKSIEVGNIFDLKDKFSKPFDLSFTNDKGEKNTILMGCYGIGLGRLMGTIAEVLSDDRGLIWPESVAPFQVHLLSLGDSSLVSEEAKKVYETLLDNKIEVLFDDRAGLSPGEKFADSDLIGVPLRVVVSERSLKENRIEVKKRTEDKGSLMSLEELLNLLKPNA